MSNQGEVEITLGESKYTLRCTPQAMRTISAMLGGFTGAYQGLSNYTYSTYVTIIAAGLNKRGAEVAKLDDQIYDNGLEPLATPLATYLSLLMNGGREPKGGDQGDDANPKE